MEDTTTISYSHKSVRNELGHVNQGNRVRGMLAHSVLLFSPESKEIVGLIEQSRWTRDIKTRGKRAKHAITPYTKKEGYKWESASTNMAARLGAKIDDVVSVCDREADIYEYLLYKLTTKQRFVVRSMQSRHIEEDDSKLYHYASQLESAGKKKIYIAQKGGRVPSMKWAYTELAKLGGWKDTKKDRTSVSKGTMARMVQVTNHP